MKLFSCSHCQQLLYFENNRCEKCGHALGFESTGLQLHPLVPQEPGASTFRLYGQPDGPTYQHCRNHAEMCCNWLVPTSENTDFCVACALNRTIPDLGQPEHRQRWQRLESAKHRLVYTLLRMGLPVISKMTDPDHGLAFDFLADSGQPGENKVMTGHADGLITVNIAEADDIEREMARKSMAEAYRTLLGHFRHEVGHYYWDQLIAGTPHLAEYRRLFGDEQADYAQALQQHYDQGPPADWATHYISAYASTHPWEDWAETWAHYLHLLDTLQTAHAFHLRVAPAADDQTPAPIQTTIAEEPFEQPDFQRLIDQWLPLTFALNSLSRSMGQPDSYPFIISPEVMEKMAFIHRVCQEKAKTPVAV